MFKPFFAALTLGLTAHAHAGTTLIQDATVFDGERVQTRRSVLLADGRIADADFHGAAPAGAIVVSGAGRTLLPGLIDAHTHAYRYLDLPLLFGVTTQVDMFTSVKLMQDVSAAMARGENRDKADLFSAGTLATAPGGHGTEYGIPIQTLTKPAQAQAWVDARIAEGSWFIKIVMERGWPGHPMPSLDRATVKALIDAAHARGKLAVVHVSNLADARAALEEGADGLVHLFLGSVITDEELRSFVALAKARHAFVIPTFSVLESIAGIKEDDVLGDAGFQRLLTREQVHALQTPYSPVPRAAVLAVPRALTLALAQAGVPVLAGTDAGNAGTQYGISLHHELAELVQAGLTPTQALAAATSVPATTFHLGQRGRIANGYKADLVLVDGDPTADIRATRHIVEVWKDGEPTGAVREKQRAAVAAEGSPRTPAALPADGRISLFSKDGLGSPLGMWVPSNDAFLGGKSSVQLKVLDAGTDGQAPLDIDAKVTAGFAFPWAGVAFMPGAQPMAPADLSNAKLLRFRARGDGGTYQVALMSQGGTMPVSQPFTAGAAWQEVSMPLSAFKGIDVGALSMIGFHAGPTPGEYHFQIADVRLLTQ